MENRSNLPTIAAAVGLATAFVISLGVIGFESPLQAMGIVLLVVLPILLGYIVYTINQAAGEPAQKKKKKHDDILLEDQDILDEADEWDGEKKKKHDQI